MDELLTVKQVAELLKVNTDLFRLRRTAEPRKGSARMIDVPKGLAEKRLIQKNAERRMELCDVPSSALFPAPPERDVEQARRISHPVHAKYAKNTAT